MSRIEDQVCARIQERALVGVESHGGMTMERDDLPLLEWLKHTQEELMDAVVYIQKKIEILSNEASGDLRVP